jgi:serine/threonine protein phosphatase PrpC
VALKLSAAAVTDVGLLREVNEDSVFTSTDLYAVADGMGGHAAGDVASSLAVTVLRQISDSGELTPETLIQALTSANSAILTSAATHAGQAGMGTTVAGLGVVRLSGVEHWIAFNIGDSRVYRFADGQLQQLTVDHSEIGEMVAAGVIDAATAQVHPRRNVVTRCLGTDPPPDPDIWVFPPVPGERFLICSDGLVVEVPDAGISEALLHEPDAERAAAVLVRMAREAGGRDNITVVVVDHLPTSAEARIDDTTIPRTRLLGSL